MSSRCYKISTSPYSCPLPSLASSDFVFHSFVLVHYTPATLALCFLKQSRQALASGPFTNHYACLEYCSPPATCPGSHIKTQAFMSALPVITLAFLDQQFKTVQPPSPLALSLTLPCIIFLPGTHHHFIT